MKWIFFGQWHSVADFSGAGGVAVSCCLLDRICANRGGFNCTT